MQYNLNNYVSVYGRGNPVPAFARDEMTGLSGLDDDEAFMEIELAVPVHGLTLRQAVAAVAAAVREKRLELEAWGFRSRDDLSGARSDKVFRWRFLGYKNGMMRYRAEKSIKKLTIDSDQL